MVGFTQSLKEYFQKFEVKDTSLGIDLQGGAKVVGQWVQLIIQLLFALGKFILWQKLL